ncbi:MAG: hypothetical protein P8Y71_24420 [Pseudolabrys sp.]
MPSSSATSQLHLACRDVTALLEKRLTQRPRNLRGRHRVLAASRRAQRAAIFKKLHRLDEQVDAVGARRPRGQPHLRVDVDVVELPGNVLQMTVEPLIAAFVRPAAGDLVRGVAEDGAELVIDANVGAEIAADLVKPHLGRVGPDAEHVREIGNRDGGGHKRAPATIWLAGTATCDELFGYQSLGSWSWPLRSHSNAWGTKSYN